MTSESAGNLGYQLLLAVASSEFRRYRPSKPINVGIGGNSESQTALSRISQAAMFGNVLRLVLAVQHMSNEFSFPILSCLHSFVQGVLQEKLHH